MPSITFARQVKGVGGARRTASRSTTANSMTRTKSYRQTAGVATLGSNPSKNKIGYMLENPSIQNYFKEKFMANYMVTVLKEKDHSSQRNSLRVVCKRFAARNDRTAT